MCTFYSAAQLYGLNKQVFTDELCCSKNTLACAVTTTEAVTFDYIYHYQSPWRERSGRKKQEKMGENVKHRQKEGEEEEGELWGSRRCKDLPNGIFLHDKSNMKWCQTLQEIRQIFRIDENSSPWCNTGLWTISVSNIWLQEPNMALKEVVNLLSFYDVQQHNGFYVFPFIYLFILHNLYLQLCYLFICSLWFFASYHSQII